MEAKTVNIKKSGGTNASTEIRFEMHPIVSYNERTGNYFAYYEEFPRASAVAKSEENVIADLQAIFRVMLREHNQEITEEALKMNASRQISSRD